MGADNVDDTVVANAMARAAVNLTSDVAAYGEYFDTLSGVIIQDLDLPSFKATDPSMLVPTSVGKRRKLIEEQGIAADEHRRERSKDRAQVFRNFTSEVDRLSGGFVKNFEPDAGRPVQQSDVEKLVKQVKSYANNAGISREDAFNTMDNFLVEVNLPEGLLNRAFDSVYGKKPKK